MKKVNHYLIVLFILSFTSMSAQVTIGSLEAPVSGALLQLKTEQDAVANGGKNADKGVGLPRVELVRKDCLQPMYSESDAATLNESQRQAHRGLVVYNVATVKSERLDEGLYVWDGNQWQEFAKTMGYADFTFECTGTAVVPMGSYIENKELTSSNTLKIKVHVITPGVYELTAVSTNGYFFTASGTFALEGDYIIYAQGQGKPLMPNEDELQFTINGAPSDCHNAKVTVLPDAGNYKIDCAGAAVHGVYWIGQQLNSSHYITIKVNVIGVGSYNITSNEVDGISFSGQGTFSTTGVQYVDLYGEGQPMSVLTKNIVFTSNSTGGEAMQCETRVRITIPKKRILSVGDGSHGIHGSAGIANMFKSADNFGLLESSTFKAVAPEVINGGTSLSTTTINDYVNTSNPVDIIWMAYPAYVTATQSSIDALIDYVKKGGVFIMMNEGMSSYGNMNFMKGLFDNPLISLYPGDVIPVGNAFIQKMPNIDNMIFNGPFGDVRGKYCGNDNGYEDGFKWLPPEDLLWTISTINYNNNSSSTVGSKDSIFMFQHKEYNFIWCGDAGYCSVGTTQTNIYPGTLTGSPNYHPTTRMYGNTNGTIRKEVHNAILMANIIAWALYQTELNGINLR